MVEKEIASVYFATKFIAVFTLEKLNVILSLYPRGLFDALKLL